MIKRSRVPLCRCRRCGHRWVARGPAVPVCCAACKSPRWDRPALWRRRPRAAAQAPLPPDPVIAAYAKDVDRTLLRENLRLSVDARFERLLALQRFAAELRRAGRTERRS